MNTKKIGITGYSRGGNVSFTIGEKRLSDVLGDGFEFAAAFGMSAECRLGGLFENPIPNSTKMYVVHGELDDYTLPGPCMDYAKKLKDAGADVKSHLVKGGYHSFQGSWVAEYDKRIQTLNNCPRGSFTDEGHFSDAMNEYLVERVKDWNTVDEVKAAFKADPAAAFTKGAKEALMHKKKGCAEYGAHDGGDHRWQGKGKPFIPMSESNNVKELKSIFFPFFKEALLK